MRFSAFSRGPGSDPATEGASADASASLSSPMHLWARSAMGLRLFSCPRFRTFGAWRSPIRVPQWPYSPESSRAGEPDQTWNQEEPRGDQGAEEPDASDRDAREDKQERWPEAGLQLNGIFRDLVDI